MGWTITEKGKDRTSSNGTYIFLKSQHQMNFHCPSDLIPVQNNMIISFVNYELRVTLERKSNSDYDRDVAAQAENFKAWDEEWAR